jgi:hypothetical protein
MDRPYLYAELTNSLCSHCLRKVEAKVIIADGRVYLDKRCPEHGRERVLISTDVDYWHQTRRFLKPSQLPRRFNTPILHGCPYDCGLCADHEQHSCLTILEITDACNLACPVCYAASSPQRTTHRSLAQIEFMLDAIVANEGEPDIVQISGGEPTIHPEFFAILDAAKRRPIKHLMLNTNGVRIAQDAAFAERLATYAPGFEIYPPVRFAPPRPDPRSPRRRPAPHPPPRPRTPQHTQPLHHPRLHVEERPQRRRTRRHRRLRPHAALRPRCHAPAHSARRPRRKFRPRPRPPHPLRSPHQSPHPIRRLPPPPTSSPSPATPTASRWVTPLKLGGRVTPLTGLIPPDTLLRAEGSTLVYERDPELRAAVFDLFSTHHSPASSAAALRQLLCCLPLVQAPATLGYENIFRVLIIQFLDAHNFDVRSVKKSCIHIAHPDGRIIPFDTYNLFYRDGLEATWQQSHTPAKNLSHGHPRLLPRLSRLLRPPRANTARSSRASSSPHFPGP